jgi:hypothetical protein
MRQLQKILCLGGYEGEVKMHALFRSLPLTLLGLVVSCASVSAGTVFGQDGCASGNEACTFVDSSTAFPVTLRKFNFDAPGAGRAQVAFNGTMVCSNAPNASFAVADLITQITTKADAVPTINKGGGLRHAILMFGTGFGTSDTFNLASTSEVSYSSGGRKSVYFRITNLRLDATVTCSFFNMSFVVTHTP